jgi:hypothetical protein
MTNDERDRMIYETHSTVMVIAEKVDEHHNTLYGNGKSGLSRDVTLLQERQDQCPARKATTTENKRLSLGYVMTAIAVASLIVTIVWGVIDHVK